MDPEQIRAKLSGHYYLITSGPDVNLTYESSVYSLKEVVWLYHNLIKAFGKLQVLECYYGERKAVYPPRRPLSKYLTKKAQDQKFGRLQK